MKVKECAKECHKIAISKGWWNEHRTMPELLCLIHSEVSEALEAYRDHNDASFQEELADIVIRVFDLAENEGIDIEKNIIEKMEWNRKRPYRHGGKKL